MVPVHWFQIVSELVLDRYLMYVHDKTHIWTDLVGPLLGQWRTVYHRIHTEKKDVFSRIMLSAMMNQILSFDLLYK